MQLISILLALVIAFSPIGSIGTYVYHSNRLASPSGNEEHDSAGNIGKNGQEPNNENENDKGSRDNSGERNDNGNNKEKDHKDESSDGKNNGHDSRNKNDAGDEQEDKKHADDKKSKDDDNGKSSNDKEKRHLDVDKEVDKDKDSANDHQNLSENNHLVNGNVRITSSGSNIYTVWDSFDGQTALTRDVLFRKSADNGDTFSLVKVVGQGAPVSMAPQITSVGQYVFIVWEGINIDYTTALDPMILTGDIFLARSTDYGETFEEPVNISRSPGSPSYDPHIAAADKNIYIAWAERFNASSQNPEGATYFVSSSDNGSKFSSPLVISGSNQGTMNLQVASAGDYVYLVWEARLYDGDPLLYAPAIVNFARSIDNGHSFEVPTELSNREKWAQYPSMITREDDVYITWHSGETGARILKSVDNGQSFTVERAFDTIHTEPVVFSISSSFKAETWCDYHNSTCFLDLESEPGGFNFTNTFTFPEGCRPIVHESIENETYALAFCSGSSLIFLKGIVNDTVFSDQISLGDLGFLGDSVQSTMYLGDNLFVAWHGADDNLYFKKFCIPLNAKHICKSSISSDSDGFKSDKNKRSSNDDNDRDKEKHNDDASKDKNNHDKSHDDKSTDDKDKSRDRDSGGDKGKDKDKKDRDKDKSDKEHGTGSSKEQHNENEQAVQDVNRKCNEEHSSEDPNAILSTASHRLHAINISNSPVRSAVPSEISSIAVSENYVYVIWLETREEIHEHSENLGLFLKISKDCGATFSEPISLSNHSGQVLLGNLAVSGKNVYVTWSEIASRDDDYNADTALEGGLYFRVSHDFGESFSQAVKINKDPYAANNHRLVATNDQVIIYWGEWNGSDDITDLRVSIDYGQTFGDIIQFQQGNIVSQNVASVAAEGNHIFVSSTCTVSHSAIFWSSQDGGLTFQPAINLSEYREGTSSYKFAADEDDVKNWSISSNRQCVFGPEIAVNKNKVYVIWGELTDQGLQDLTTYTKQTANMMLTSSQDFGMTFDAPVIIGKSTIIDFINSWGSRPHIAAFDDNVYVTWDTKNDHRQNNMLFRVSHDDGLSFGPTINLSLANDDSYDLHLTTAPNGIVYATWMNEAANALCLRASTDAGRSFSDVIDLTSYSNSSLSDSFRPGFLQLVATEPNGHLYMTWEGYVYDLDEYDVYFMKLIP